MRLRIAANAIEFYFLVLLASTLEENSHEKYGIELTNWPGLGDDE